MVVEGVLVVAIYLLVVTVAWLNEPGSLWRLGLALGSWGLVAGAAARGITVRRRVRHPS